MSACDVDRSPNKENVLDIRLPTNDVSSQDIFSDDDQQRHPTICTPKYSPKNDSFNISLISLKTPVFLSKTEEITPGRATIPKTPAGLLPFITKTDLVWTSDMETPEAKYDVKPESCDATMDMGDMNNITPVKTRTESPQIVKDETLLITSPVLGGKKRAKRRFKRRILNNLTSNLDNDQQCSISSNSDKVPSDTASNVSYDLLPCNGSNVVRNGMKDEITSVVCEDKSGSTVEDEPPSIREMDVKDSSAAIPAQNLNTSTQEFFLNASFSSIDQLCNGAVNEQSNSLHQLLSNNNAKSSKCPDSVPTSHVSRDVLERVAAIRRNQKPLKRSSDINQVSISHEIFLQTARDLESADAKFRTEKKIKTNQRKLTEVTSFAPLSSLDSDLSLENAETIETEEVKLVNGFAKDQQPGNDISFDELGENHRTIALGDNANWASMPVNANLCVEKSTDPSETLHNQLILRAEVPIQSETGDSSMACDDAFVKNAIRNENIENKTLSSVCSLSPSENPRDLENQPLPIHLEKTECEPEQQISEQNEDETQSCLKKYPSSKEMETLKLYQELDLKEFLEPKFPTTTTERHDDSVDSRKEVLETDPIVYDDCLLESNTSKSRHSVCSPEVQNQMMNGGVSFDKENSDFLNELPLSNIKTKVKTLNMQNDGFSTASGLGIKIDDRKESFYSKLYEELDDNFDSTLMDKKKMAPTKQAAIRKPTDKAVIVFNKTPNMHVANGRLNRNNPKIHHDQTSSASNSPVLGQRKKSLNLKAGSKFVDERLKLEKFSSNVDSALDDKPSTSEIPDGFATASGQGIRINEEKENHFLRIYNDISKELNSDGDFSVSTKNVSGAKLKVKPTDKAVITFNHKKTEDGSRTKLSISSDTDEAFYDLGDLETFFTSPKHKISKKSESSNDNFVIPNAENIIQKVGQSPSIPQNCAILKEELPENLENVVKLEAGDSNLDLCSKILKAVQPNDLVERPQLPNKSHIGILKQKIKKPERCRSFGGFPVSSDVINASKLNKSDPLNESSTNQPLQTGLSASQCFDPHSDSWLSNVEITHLNNKKMSPLNIKFEKSDSGFESNGPRHSVTNDELIDDFRGFSSKEVNESLSRYIKFQKFYNESTTDYGCNCSVNVKKGQTITIINNTSADQQLIVGSGDVNIEKKRNRFTYSLVQCEIAKQVEVNDRVLKRKKTDDSKCDENPKTKKFENEQVIDKRKRVTDPDSDTPVTTLKKPRVGCEIQGRKLFSDESDAEHDIEPSVDMESQIVTSTEGTSKDSNNDTVMSQEEIINLTQQRRDAIFDQEETYNNKKRIRVKPMMGSLLKHRLMNSKNRVSWAELVGDSLPRGRSREELAKQQIDVKIAEITSSNSVQYKFSSNYIFRNKKSATLDVGDGAILIFDESGNAGVAEFRKSFLSMAGVDPKLLHANWIENHYRWIVWKLASMDRQSFGNVNLPKMLTPKRVIDELKYRYDREIDRAQRPALRKILEKDEVPSHRMVLCISSITENSNNEEAEKEVKVILGMSRWRVEATDGWYDIPLTIDNAMQSYIVSGKIKEGTKIVTYGAELLDCERGFHPLDKPANVSLRIHTNCTRRARWDAKLGFQRISRPIPVKLSQIVSSGGMVGEITVVAARVYPPLYREKTSDGQSIYRNAKSEEKAEIAYQRAVEKKVDAMYAEAEKNLQSKKKPDSDDEMEISQGATETQEIRSRERHHEQMKQRIESRVREGLPPRRDVIAVLKVRLCDDTSNSMLTIWGANDSDEAGYDIKEGDTITVYNSSAAGFRGGELNLSANRYTRIKKELLLKLPYPVRTCTLIPNIGLISSFEPKYNEFDTVGVVTSSGPAPYGMKNFDMVALAHPKPNEGDVPVFLAVLFWGGVSAFGYQGVLTPGSLVSCSNLEWRRSSSWSIAVAYCSDRSVFTSNPRQAHLANELRELKALVRNPKTFAESCGVDLANELLKKPQPRSIQGTPSTSGASFLHKTLSPLEQQQQSTPVHNSAIQRRLEKLSRYGTVSSADISPIVLSNTSSRVKKDFIPVTPRPNP
ncbi:hypothetical protein QAD02_008994 [Eretmocerus hayati]|uniref:Uncharacterized protein n=1 Tax=Eretmocerus hayati TaxID=131215 RepID=A0ACC2NAH0_9HYME|nr:hypothetical protein QAD02_008994 [Eretmocerus hayati]